MSSTRNISVGASRLQLKKFPIHEMAEHCTIAMIAKRASGKSYLTKEILYHKRDIPAVTIISKTEKLNKFYGDFCPDTYIYDKFDTEILTRIYERQSIMNEDNSKRKSVFILSFAHLYSSLFKKDIQNDYSISLTKQCLSFSTPLYIKHCIYLI